MKSRKENGTSFIALLCGVALTIPIQAQFQATPLTDYQSGQRYLGQYPGHLYESGNLAPADHDAAGVSAALSVKPINGRNPVMISVGESNSTMTWCDNSWPKCTNWSFIGQAAASPQVNHSTLTIVDGAYAGSTMPEWACAYGPCGNPKPPTPSNQYDRVRDQVLTPNHLLESDVQAAVFVEVARKFPGSISLPAANADAFVLESLLAQSIRAAKTRWPNLKIVFLNSRIYAGYAAATDKVNPEPFAYEGGFSCKWVIQAQITQRRTGVVDPIAGDMLTNAPWVGWTAYTWGNGLNNPTGSSALSWYDYDANPNGDQRNGPFILPDMDCDNIHPARGGQTKAAARMLEFFLISAYSPWFRP